MSQVYYPPGVECFHPDGGPAWNGEAYQAGGCEVTDDMLAFLNLTSISSYITAYCLNPAPDDSCPFGFCPNPDIAGVWSERSSWPRHPLMWRIFKVLLLESPVSGTRVHRGSQRGILT